ncbi:MAG: hypothetical protein LKI34_08035 [Bifidobacterium tibiigranuli]|jgi:hypothetical protein|uniref:hypothetical protein n=1 Tax=Bifidobacterium tibiigranuli TaxID=2172043 RepID=UPI0026EBD9AB|nr:hypothetical protein [Bifidobacterium tibiigranuli]MCI1674146.1 hypothetical protein [Bifidobacterium tibiigranuli]MCI1712493.1 hypothetical protein [Bifidobacterium tibiigranuli]
MSLQGFEEVPIAEPTGKLTMTVMDSKIRFNKTTAIVLGYPAYIKVLINGKTRQIALQACTGRDANAIKFSKPEGKQTSSVTVNNKMLVAAIGKFFTFKPAPEGVVSYQTAAGRLDKDEKVVVFDAANAVAGTMKQRGRKKAVEGR